MGRGVLDHLGHIECSRIGSFIPEPQVITTHELRSDAGSMGGLLRRFPHLEFRPRQILIVDKNNGTHYVGRIVDGDVLSPSKGGSRYLQIYAHAWAHASWIEEIALPYISVRDIKQVA